LVRKMLERDPRQRITAHEVLCKWFHSFASGYY
jgi:serine/threonine protein kinase